MQIKDETLSKEIFFQALNFKCLTTLSMLSVTFLIVSMLFAYRVIEFGPFLTPGGVFIFPLTYFFADIIAEVYGYDSAKLLIWGNFACIFIFNLTCYLLIKLPIPYDATYFSAYQIVFSHSFSLILGFSLSFAASDFINAFAISRWKILLKGKYFWLRSIGSSLIGELLFTMVATITLYAMALEPKILVRELVTTWIIKMLITFTLAYPAVFIAAILKKIENIDVYDYSINFNPFKIN